MNKIIPSNPLSFKFLFILILILFSSFSLHKYYVGLTQIEYNINNKRLEITLKLFTDDLELTLNNQYANTFELGTSAEKKVTNEAINNYVNQKMQIKINGKNAPYKMIGKEFEDDMTLIYFEINGIKNMKSIEVTNKLLFETFEDQHHILKIKSSKTHKNLLLSKNKFKEIIKIE